MPRLVQPLNVESDNDRVILALEEALEEARKGSATDVIIAMSCRHGEQPSYYNHSEFADIWRLLGAIEYAKNAIFRRMGRIE